MKFYEVCWPIFPPERDLLRGPHFSLSHACRKCFPSASGRNYILACWTSANCKLVRWAIAFSVVVFSNLMCHPSVYKYNCGTLYNEEETFGNSLSEKLAVERLLILVCVYASCMFPVGSYSVRIRPFYGSLPSFFNREYCKLPAPMPSRTNERMVEQRIKLD